MWNVPLYGKGVSLRSEISGLITLENHLHITEDLFTHIVNTDFIYYIYIYIFYII